MPVLGPLDAVGLASGLVTLVITIRMRGSLVRPGTWRSCPPADQRAIWAGNRA
jgi:hypothetical protein